MTWHLMGVSPNKTLSHLLYFLGSIFRSHETIWKGSSVEQDGATRRKLVRLAQFADGHRNCSCCGVKYHESNVLLQAKASGCILEYAGTPRGDRWEANWDELRYSTAKILSFCLTILSWFMFSFFLHCSLHHSGFLPFVTGCYGPSKSSTTPFTWEKKTPGLWWSQFVFGVTAQGYRMLVTWHVFNEATAVVKKSLWHLCKSQWRGGSLLTTCSDELPIKDVASLAVGKSTTALMFRVLFMPYICSTVDACSLGFGWSLVDICHCSSCSSPNNGMTRGWWPSDQPNWGGQRGVHGGDPGGAQTSQARHELAWTAYSSRKQDIDL